MRNHTKVYLKHCGYWGEYIPCEICGREAVDIHHIEPRGMGGSKNKDTIENLMGLCRECHSKAESKKISKEELKETHNNFLTALN